MAVKTATIEIALAFYMHCPYCEEGVETPNDGLLFIQEDLKEIPNEIECRSCGKAFRLPAKIVKLRDPR